MNAQTYAHALHRALENADKSHYSDIIARLGEAVRQRGHSKLARGILQAYEAIQVRTEGKRAVRLIVADEANSENAFSDVRTRYPEIDLAACKVIVEPSLIGGWRLETGECVIDGSYKKKLLALHRRFTERSNMHQ